MGGTANRSELDYLNVGDHQSGEGSRGASDRSETADASARSALAPRGAPYLPRAAEERPERLIEPPRQTWTPRTASRCSGSRWAGWAATSTTTVTPHIPVSRDRPSANSCRVAGLASNGSRRQPSLRRRRSSFFNISGVIFPTSSDDCLSALGKGSVVSKQNSIESYGNEAWPDLRRVRRL